MYHHTKAIVLHHIKYSDTSLVVNMYTEIMGRQSFMVQGVYRKKSKFPPTYFQPLTHLEIELSISHKRELQRLKEVSIIHPYTHIPFNPAKSAIALFLSEILYKTLREEEPNPPLFHFLENSLLLLDMSDKGIANFHLWFLINFSKYLGFYPVDNFSASNCVFDITNGRFYASPLKTPIADELAFAAQLHQLMNTSSADLEKIALNHRLRNFLLEGLIQYYHVHLGHMGAIKSQQVLQEVFSDN